MTLCRELRNNSSAVAEMGDRLATIYMCRKVGGCCAPFGWAGSPSNTMWPGPRPTSIPRGIPMHPTVWPQYTNVTDRRTGQADNDSIAWGEPFYKRSSKEWWKRSRCCLVCELGWAQWSMYYRWCAHWRHLANNILPSTCCVDAAFLSN